MRGSRPFYRHGGSNEFRIKLIELNRRDFPGLGCLLRKNWGRRDDASDDVAGGVRLSA
jgi:hypothetical protein